MTVLSITDLITPATSDEWKATILKNADILQLNTTSWESGSPARTMVAIVAALMSQGDAVVSIIAQGGFLDFAATGSVTYTAANGQTVTQAVTPDPSDPTENPTGAAGWLDLLADSVYDVQRLQASFATGQLAIGNASTSTLTYAAGTYHVANADRGTTFKNATDISVPQGTVLGGSVTAVSNGAPMVVVTASAHGLSNGSIILITDVVGIPANGIFVVTVVSPTAFSLNGTDGTISTPYVSGGTVRTVTMISVVADVSGEGSTSIRGAITKTITTNPKVFCLNPATIFGSGFESNVALAARCRSRLASLSPNGAKGAYKYFALSASDILGNPENPLFVAPAVSTPAITRAEVFPNKSIGAVAVVVASATGSVGGVTNLAISNVSATTPIQVTTSAPQTLSTGDPATLSGILGATTANGTWTITVIDATNFTLNGSVGGAAYAGGGTVEGGVLGQVDRIIQANAVPDTDTVETVSAISFPVAIVATVRVPVAYVASYTQSVQIALALFTAALRIGGGSDGFYRYNDVVGVLYAAGIVGTQPSYVTNIDSLTLNGVAADLPFPGNTSVASITVSPPVINVVGV